MSDLESVVCYLSRAESRKSVLTKLSPRLLSKLVKEIEEEISARDEAKKASRLLKKKLLQRAEELGIPYDRLKQKLEKERRPARKITYEINGQLVQWSGRGARTKATETHHRFGWQGGPETVHLPIREARVT